MEPTQSREDLKAHRNDVIVFILNSSSTKYPIKQADLLSLFDKNKKVFNVCFDEAKKCLKKVYGINVYEVPDSKTGKKFICYSDVTASTICEYNDRQKSEITLLFIILSFIFMLGGNVYEDRIEEFLKGLKIFYNEDHDFFGSNIKKLITETFVKQLYLKKTKSDSECDTETRFVYSWGVRSNLEFPKKLILDATAKIVDRPKNIFVQQLIEAEAIDEDDEEAN